MASSVGSTSSSNEITEEGDQAQYQQQFQQRQPFSTPIQYSTQPQRQSTTPYFDGYNTNQPYFPYPPQEDVTVFIAYDGKWEWDGKEWFFKDSTGILMELRKNVTLAQLTDILHTRFSLFQSFWDLKLEVHYRVGSPWFPIIEIKNDHDLSAFISESSKTKLPLCVTRVAKSYVLELLEGAKHRRKDDTVEHRLWRAIHEDNWVKARYIVNTEEVTWTSKIDSNENSALHFAVGRNINNEIVRHIVTGINSELLVTTVNTFGETPANRAATFGNTEALKLMVDSNPECLIKPDIDDFLPIHNSFDSPGIETFLYLFNQMKSNKDHYEKIYGGRLGVGLLHDVIDAGLIDIAYEFVNRCPSLATTVHYNSRTALECIIGKPELFYSGTSYSFYSRFLYHIVPIKNKSLGSTDTADVENQETPKKDKFVTKHWRRCLHDGMLYMNYVIPKL